MPPEVNKIRLTVLIALMFSALCAGVFRTPPILFMAALLTSAPFVGWIVGRWSSRSLRITRVLPESGLVGDVLTGEIRVENLARLPAFLVHARCGIATLADKSRLAVAPLGSDEYVLPILKGKAGASWHQQWVLQKRGVHRLGAARVGAIDPLGLSTFLARAGDPQTITVLPRPVHIEQLGFWGGAGLEQTPRHSTIVADAMDFHGVRVWQHGEPIRRAHWKSTARTGQLHVIEWEETPASDLAILLDAHAEAIAGSDDDNTLETSITVAASLACYLLENGCSVQLFYFTQEQDAVHLKSVSERSVEGLNTILHALAQITPVHNRAATATQLAQSALPQIARGLGALLIASSRSSLPSSLEGSGHAAQSRSAKLKAFLLDAESFAAPPEPVSEASGSPDFAATQAARRGSRQSHFQLRRGQSIGAALEGRW